MLNIWFMAITDWPRDERPREKLSRYGPASLSDAELLASVEGYGSLIETFAVIGLDELCQRIGSGQLSAFAVASALKGLGDGVLIAGTAGLDARSRLMLDGQPVRGITYCCLCKPMLGDEIVAIASFSGVKIHRITCPEKEEGRAANGLFTPAWAARLTRALPVEVRVMCNDRKGLLADCARVVSECDIDVTAVHRRRAGGRERCAKAAYQRAGPRP